MALLVSSSVNHGRHVRSSIPVPLKTRRVGQRCTLNLSRAETSSRWCGVVVRRVGCQLRGRTLWEWLEASHLSSPSTNLTRRLAARRLFRVPPCRAGTVHLQVSMSSPGFEPSPYGTAVSIANHYRMDDTK
ncbi:hypothetical protein TNCV_1627191 [Trichonephila clavipes]|nr:hypothetical protein TNCV_1627191 [Trichonephila clavipes]